MPDPKNRPVRILAIIMIALVIAGVTIAWIYYKGVNESVDPRIKRARLLYEKYNDHAQMSRYDSIFCLMDSIEQIYNSVDHYKNSYETGVLYNNRAASYLSAFLQKEKDTTGNVNSELIDKAEKTTLKSIHIYQQWFDEFQGKTEAEVRELIKNDFLQGLNQFSKKEKEKFLEQRVHEIIEAQKENERRLSVSYTNLGMVKRYQMKYDSAAIFYKKAMDLWDRNLTAENNLNILLNRPLKKRNLIQKLFPPER